MHQYGQRIIQAVASWDNVETFLHRFGGVEFKLDDVEFGHMHMGSGTVDIRFPPHVSALLVAEGEAERHYLYAEMGWVSVRNQLGADEQHAIRLFRLSYLRKVHAQDADCAALLEAVAELGFSDAVIQSLQHKPKDAEVQTE